MAAIECRDVHRHFKDVRAVDGVSLTVETHQIFGLLGPNGSGKTTLLNVLQGLDRPTSGTVSVLGLDPIAQHDVLVEQMGTQLQEATIIPRLTVREALQLFSSFYSRTRSIDDLLAQLGLQEKANSRVERLSGGQRQRMFIALALLHDPELLFFDELTSAVDPQARLAIWDVLRGLRDEGRTIMLTTHSMAEAQALCDQVAIIDAGKIIAEGEIPELVAKYAGGSTLRLRVNGAVSLDALQRLDDVAQVTCDGDALVVTGERQFVPEVMAHLAASGVGITSMHLEEASLEDVFLALTGREMREGEWHAWV